MSPVEVFTCGICQSRFTQKRNLSRHLNSKHIMQLWNCHKCNKSFNRKDNLRVHARSCIPIKRSRNSDIEFGFGLIPISKFDESQKAIATATENSQPTTSSTERSNHPNTVTLVGNVVEWKEKNWSPRDPPNELKLKTYEAVTHTPPDRACLSPSQSSEKSEDSIGQSGKQTASTPEFENSKAATSTNSLKRGSTRIVRNQPFNKENGFASKIDQSIVNRKAYEERAADRITVRIDGNQSMIPRNTCDGQQTTGAKISQKYEVRLEGNKPPLQANVQNLNTLEALHTRLARQAVRQTILKYLPENIAPVLQASEINLWCNSDSDEFNASVIGNSPPSKRVRRQSPTHSYDIPKEVKEEVLSSDYDCELVDVQQGAAGVSSKNANKPTSSLLYDIVEPKSVLRDEPQFLVVRMRGKEAVGNRTKIYKNELKRKIALLRDERDAILDQEKLNEEKLKIMLHRKQQLEENIANVALQKAIKKAELSKCVCLLQEWERQ